MKICMVAPVHIYDDVRVFKKEAISLSNKGHNVILYSRIDRERVVNGVHVKPYMYRNRFFRFIKLPFLLYKLILENADVYHLHNPDTIPLGLFLRFLRKRVVYDTHENFKVRIMNRNWIPKYLRLVTSFVVDNLEILMSYVANSTIVTQEAQVSKFKKSILINNSPIIDDESITEIRKRSEKIIDDTELRLIYLGAITEDRGSVKMLDLINKLNKKTNARLWLIGQADEQKTIERLKQHDGWAYVDYLGRLPQDIAFSYLSKSTVGLIILQDKKQYMDTNPNKLYEYLLFGIPFIASDYPYWKSQVGEANAGYFVNPGNTDDIIDRLLFLKEHPTELQRMKNNGISFIRDNFNWRNEEIKLFKLYEEILN